MHSKLLLCFGLTGSLVLLGCADDGGNSDEPAATETGDGDGDPGDGDGDPTGDGDGDPTGDGDGDPTGDGDGDPTGDGDPGDGDGEPGDGDPGDGDGEPGDGDGDPGDGDPTGDGDGEPGDGDGDPGDGNCKVTYETCDALQAAFAAEAASIRGCTEDSQCGQVLNGTSCGCTRDWVARIDADTECFYALIEQADAIQCGLPLVSTCDCPPADGYVCFDGICAWNYL